IHHIHFDDENNVINKNIFTHREGEIWHISASTIDKSFLTTCYNKTTESKAEMKAALWKLPTDFDDVPTDDQSSLQPVSLMCHLEAPDYGDMNNNVVGLADNHVIVWDVDTSSKSAKMVSSAALETKGQPRLTCSSWDPHHNSVQIATANDTAIRGWDLRSLQQTFVIDNAHGQLVRDLDFNPNKQYYLLSCGDDCKVKFWDIRNINEPMKILSDHSHWVWSVRYNRFHDQLILSSSSDSRVILNSVVSLSSEPYGHEIENDDDEEDGDKHGESSPPEDRLIATYEEHEDSVYCVDWSTADPWVFASLSYDGRLVINRVPRVEKYKILL
ncbi:EIPR1-like protein, partial [Mya arenaria]